MGARLLARLLFKVELRGRENLPAAGSIVTGAPHRNWVEPFLLLGLLPRRPIWIADRRTVVGPFVRRWAARLAGGSIPVGGRGARAFDDAVAEVRRALGRGRTVVIFPETGGPSRPPALRRLSAGVAQMAAGAGSQVVPIVFGGTDELYLRRRIVVTIRPAIAPPTDAQRATVDAWMAELEATLSAAAVEAHLAAQTNPLRRRWWRWLSGNFPRA